MAVGNGCGVVAASGGAGADGAGGTDATTGTAAGTGNCPVTIGHPVPHSKYWWNSLFGSAMAHGNKSLWVGALWPHGVVIITADNIDSRGYLGMKFGWYRLKSGFLRITGKRLDAPAPPLQAITGGYGMFAFNASDVIFPTEGCWRVTGMSAGTRSPLPRS